MATSPVAIDAIDEHLHLAADLLLQARGADLGREFHETGAALGS